MAGHNKWSKVKRKKEVLDAKKSKVFSDLARQLTLAAREAKGDKNSPHLKTIIEKARSFNMPNENIERAIEKGLGGKGAGAQEVLYEAYGPGGCALLIQGFTDNKNRTSQEIKHLLSELGISLSTPGSALWAFSKNETGYEARDLIPVSDEDKEKISEIISALEKHADIDALYSNALL
jgi:YebC/PmpR family DNA-binding regulatory protein